jgi:DNA (cytosine-5)-methyltransferase 1
VVSKILNKNFPNIPIATDVKELAHDAERLVPDHDILTAGYPCQPFSVAGLRKARKDDRHIWPYIFRIITQKDPLVVLENVYGHVALGLDKVLADLESQGYATRTFIVPACAKNAPHRRDRMWIIAKNVEDPIGGRCEERDSESEEVSRSLLTSAIRTDVGNSQHDGSSASTIRGSNEEDARRSTQGKIEAKQSKGASGRRHDEDVADSTSNGRNESQPSEEQGSTFGQSEEGRMLELEGGGSQSSRKTLAYSKCLGWEQRTTEQGELDRERPPDQLNFSGEGFGRSRSSSHVADTSSEGLQGRTIDSSISNGGEKESQLGNESGGAREDVADTNRQRGRGGSTRREDAEDAWKSSRVREDEGIWFAEPNVGRVAHGVSKRVDRLKGLGNAIVPSLAMQIGLAIKEEIKKDD